MQDYRALKQFSLINNGQYIDIHDFDNKFLFGINIDIKDVKRKTDGRDLKLFIFYQLYNVLDITLYMLPKMFPDLVFLQIPRVFCHQLRP